MARILITSTQYPYYGGAATNSYALIKYFRSFGHAAAGIFFEPSKVNVDPDKIGGVWRFDPAKDDRVILTKVVTRYLDGEPDLVFGKNYGAPVISKKIFPRSKVVYLVTGSPQMADLSEKGISAQRYLSPKFETIKFKQELECIDKSDLVIPNSHLGYQLLIKNYGKNSKFLQPIDTSFAFNNQFSSTIEFEKRKWDVGFVCSNLSRKVKNAELAKSIFSRKEMNNLKKVIIGKDSNIFKNIPNTTTIGLSEHKDVLKTIQDTRLIICTSYYDASPNTIKEAVMCGSNILVSLNCGWAESYPKEFVCSDVYDLNEWLSKALHLVNHRIEFSLNKQNILIEKMNKIIGSVV